jgi:hypothetical protein
MVACELAGDTHTVVALQIYYSINFMKLFHAQSPPLRYRRAPLYFAAFPLISKDSKVKCIAIMQRPFTRKT